MSCELRIDESELGRDRTEGVHEPNDFDPALIGVRLGVVRPQRFRDCHELGALFRPRRSNPLESTRLHGLYIGFGSQVLQRRVPPLPPHERDYSSDSTSSSSSRSGMPNSPTAPMCGFRCSRDQSIARGRSTARRKPRRW